MSLTCLQIVWGKLKARESTIKRFVSTQTGLHWINSKATSRPVIAGITSEYLVRILTSKVYDAAIETPLNYAANLSALLKNKVFLKREDTQPVFSFKIRGAQNKIANLSEEQRRKGVVACSAGNHAQGVAWSSAQLGINAKIIMPEATPKIKVDSVRRFGGETVEVILHGKNYDEAAALAKQLVHEKDYTMVHPFDDPDVIAGQGTVGLEILKVSKLNASLMIQCCAPIKRLFFVYYRT